MHMMNKFFALWITSMFLLASLAVLSCMGGKIFEVVEERYESSATINNNEIFYHDDTQDPNGDEWHYLPSFPNYAPCGLPDFDQRQQEDWKNRRGHYTFCGPVALANILWWFDSKYANPDGTPGDGNDTYFLVCDYHAPGTPNPGPYSDDHSFNNVNDLQTPWDKFGKNDEIIEKIASYVNTNWYKIPIISLAGTNHFQMKWGIEKWFKDTGLQHRFDAKIIFRPSFPLIAERLQQNQGIILSIAFYNPYFKLFPFSFGHYVAVAGMNPNGAIALSDPIRDMDSPLLNGVDYTLHNDASIVSHDRYDVNFTSPSSWLASWWLPDYPVWEGAVLFGAVIISEVDYVTSAECRP